MKKLFKKRIDPSEDITEFYNFILNNTDYFTDYVQHTPTKQEVREEFLIDVPPNINLQNKEVFGIYNQEELIGFLDLLFHYPDDSTCMIGYLVIDQRYRKQGLGQKIYNEVVTYLSKRDISKVRLGVIKDNIPAVKMWEKQGFEIIDQLNSPYGEQLTMELGIENR